MPVIVKMISTRLQELNYEVFGAFDGEQALEMVRSVKPDIIFLDIMMPKMDGFTFIRTLKSDEQFKDIPIIVVSSKEDMMSSCTLEGAEDFLVKPVVLDAILEKVNKYLGT